MEALLLDLRELVWPAGRLCRLGLVLPQVWLWVMLRAVDRVPGATNLAFYTAEGVALLVVFSVGMARRTPAATTAMGQTDARAPFRRLFGTLAPIGMAVAPALALFGGPALGPGVTLMAEVLGAVGLVWSYLAYFAVVRKLDLRSTIRCILLSFALVPLVRLPVDMMPVEAAAVSVALLPILFVALNHLVERADSSSEAESAPTTGALDGPARIAPLVVQAVVFGLAMGLFRASADGVHDQAWYVALNFAAKTLLPFALLLATERLWQRMSLGSLCQLALVILTVAMAAAVNLAQFPYVTFMVFDFARYSMVVLLFVALPALARRTALDSRVVFAGGMGTYSAALAVGMALARVVDTGTTDSAVLMLDVACALLVCTVLAGGLGERDDLRLFADGSPELAPTRPGDEIDARCGELADAFALTPRELETMRLICRGRSKRYIAEQLSLSENTVRGYAKTLYAKLGVHSRQELLTLVGVG